MKKFYLLAGGLLALSSLNAQLTVDFEDVTLPKVDTFYNGSDNANSFVSENVTFNVDYDATNDFWAGGFAYSNMRNDSTSGFSNLYSAYPATGANGSDNYGLNTDGDTLFFPNPSNLTSIEITNTTYAYLSMRDGDAFAKEFGSPNDADGNPDGTNGEDYFYITIYGHDATNNISDSVNIYLADFTSTDTTDHYILDTWKETNLSNLEAVNYLTFKYFSSDVGAFGINTPKFFALDNLIYEESPTNNLSSEETTSFKVFPNPAKSFVKIKGLKGDFTIYSMKGMALKSFTTKETTPIDVSDLKSGVYFIKPTHQPSPTKKLIIQ